MIDYYVIILIFLKIFHNVRNLKTVSPPLANSPFKHILNDNVDTEEVGFELKIL